MNHELTIRHRKIEGDTICEWRADFEIPLEVVTRLAACFCIKNLSATGPVDARQMLARDIVALIDIRLVSFVEIVIGLFVGNLLGVVSDNGSGQKANVVWLGCFPINRRRDLTFNN